MGRKLDQVIGALNGVVGDYLARRGNGLAIPMELVKDGAPVAPDAASLARAYAPSGRATPRVVVLLHGVCCTETVWDFPDGNNYGAMLAADLGYTPLYLRYNSGLAIGENGRALDRLLESVVAAYPGPLDEILPLGFSMGGLVFRSACHVALERGAPWLALVRRAIYIGTPHLGAPLERVGRVVAKVLETVDDPYTRLAADLGNLRSDGVKDLGDADLRHEDRAHVTSRLTLRDRRHPVPLLSSIQHYLVAGSISDQPWAAELFGDSLVPISSGTHGAGTERASPGLSPEHVKIIRGVHHLGLARNAEVYAQIRAWCEDRREDRREEAS
jgi:pimeloyl-ACP methyl ester carboxylesterase